MGAIDGPDVSTLNSQYCDHGLKMYAAFVLSRSLVCTRQAYERPLTRPASAAVCCTLAFASTFNKVIVECGVDGSYGPAPLLGISSHSKVMSAFALTSGSLAAARRCTGFA